MTAQKLGDLATPALVLDADVFDRNIAIMAAALPGERLRPHVKAHKCTEIGRRQHAAGHALFCCATVLEMVGMAEAGLGEDLLLANETLDASRLSSLDARITVAVDSEETIAAATKAGIREVLIDVNVGLPRCGCAPEDAGRLADLARRNGLEVRGVMGYEGHVVGNPDRAARVAACEQSMALLLQSHRQVGGDLVSGGGTGTYDCNTWATEIQAGSYCLMDTSYSKLDLPFEQAFFVWSTVISVGANYAVLDSGLKSLGMDHGNPSIENAAVWFCSDEHITFAPESPVRVGDRVKVVPAHVDPTIAYHERFQVISGEDCVDVWEIDLRGW